jgi:Tfp pilus assembly protein PilF
MRIHSPRGNVKRIKGNLEGALTDINKSIALDPKNAEAYCNLGLAQLSQGQDSQATLSFNRCYDLDGKLRPKFEKQAKGIKNKVNKG